MNVLSWQLLTVQIVPVLYFAGAIAASVSFYHTSCYPLAEAPIAPHTSLLCSRIPILCRLKERR